MPKSTFFRLTIVLFPLVVVATYIGYSSKKRIDLLSNPDYEIVAFSDKWENQSSEAATNRGNDGSVAFSYTLRKGADYPYAGMLFRRKDSSFFDTRDYRLSLEIIAEQKVRMPIRLTLFADDYSNLKLPNSLVFQIFMVTLEQGTNQFSISTNDINDIPDWWYTLNKITENDLKHHHLSKEKTVHLSFFSDPSYPLDKHIRFEVKTASLSTNWHAIGEKCMFFLVLYGMGVWLLSKYLQKRGKTIFVPVAPVLEAGAKGKPVERVMVYIGLHYSNPELKLGDVAKEVGLTEANVSELLRQQTNMTFKQYLNNLRMTEAKRLLSDHNYNISEIAYKVGYSSIQHFNRVFKENIGYTPSQFREKHSQS